VMIGPYVADVSIFRTAYSAYGLPRLSKHIDLVFGPNQGLYVDQWKRTRKAGLGYEPRYVLSERGTDRSHAWSLPGYSGSASFRRAELSHRASGTFPVKCHRGKIFSPASARDSRPALPGLDSHYVLSARPFRQCATA